MQLRSTFAFAALTAIAGLAPAVSAQCVGPQVFFGNDWQNSSYTVNSQTPQWFILHDVPTWDVACINDQSGIPAIWSNNCWVGCRRHDFWMKARGNPDDNSAMGFVLGFCDGDQNNPNADYLAVIWFGDSETAQLPGCGPSGTHPRGMRLVRVTGIPDPQEFWSLQNLNLPCSGPNSGVEVLATANTLGDTSWPRFIPQNVTFEMTRTNLKVWINGTLEIDRDGNYTPYEDGCFGYYNQGLFADYWRLITTATNPVVASWNNYGQGIAGCNGIPTLRMLNRPQNGTNPRIELGNPTSAPKTGAMVWSLMPDNVFVPFLGANILVSSPFAAVTTEIVPPGGGVFDCTIDDNSCQNGQEFYLQWICPDTCAAGGWAMSPGLRIVLGDL